MPEADACFLELLGRHFARRIGQGTACGLRFRKRDHVTNTFGARHQHDDAIETERDATVRRAAVLQRPQQEAELLFRLFFADAQKSKTAACMSWSWIRIEPPPISEPFSTMS